MNSVGEFLGRGANLFLFMIVLPMIWGCLLLLFGRKKLLQRVVAVVSAVFNLVFAIGIYTCGEFITKVPGAPYGFTYSLRVYAFSSFFVVLMAVVFLLIILYMAAAKKKMDHGGLYLFYLYLAFAMMNGVLLSDNLGMLLLFWEGLLVVSFGMLLIGNMENPKTAVKAIVTKGLAVLLLMLGIILTAHVAGTSTLSEMKRMPLTGACLLGFLTMMLGVLGQCSVMPFHSWSLNAAEDSPIEFLSAFPGALEKIIGVYLAARIVMDIYNVTSNNSMQIVIMVLGIISIIFAGAMALIQKDIKRILAYVSVSQVGFIILGIGTGVAEGICGGFLYLISDVICMTGLFMISGTIENDTGTTDLTQLGGSYKKMPVLAVCLILCGLSAVGFPGTMGFYSGKYILDAAEKVNMFYYVGAVAGMFLIALSLVNMGRSLFLKEPKVSKEPLVPTQNVRKKEGFTLLPIGVLSVTCVVAGLFTAPWSKMMASAYDARQPYVQLQNIALFAGINVLLLILAIGWHRHGFLEDVYRWSEKGWFDPYRWFMGVVGIFSDICMHIEHVISWIYDTAVPGLVKKAGSVLHNYDNGNILRYLSLAVIGVAFITVIFVIELL
jgi:formate hydrogenlyase subunit 3/multisubunit Na+/H+ antiporter MnhD subunit